MTTQRTVYLALFLILLAAFLAAGGSMLWTAVSLRGRLPRVEPIDDAIKTACNDLAAKLAAGGRFGTFGPVESVQCEAAAADDQLDAYAHAVNTWFAIAMQKQASAPDKLFALKFNDADRKLFKQYAKKLLAQKERGFAQLDTEALFTGRPCDYLLRAAWSWQHGGAGGMGLLTLSVLSASGGQQRVATTAPVEFTHPKAARWVALRQSALAVSGVGLALVVGIFVACRHRCQSHKQELIEAARNYLADERLVAAHNVATKLLTYLPNNADARQLQMDIPDDPVHAQLEADERRGLKERAAQALAEFEPIVRSMEPPKPFRDITDSELWKRMDALKAHDSRLEHAMLVYLQYKAEWEEATAAERERKELDKRCKELDREVKRLLAEGRPTAAAERVKELGTLNPNWQALKLLEDSASSVRETLQKHLDDARRLLDAGDPAAALAEAEQAHQADADADEPKRLAESIRASSNGLRLAPKTVGKPLLMLAQTSLEFGRREGDVIVDKAKVSGKHLRLSVADNKLVAQDLGSKNHTFFKGAEFTVLEVDDGAVLDMGRACELHVHVQRSDAGASGVQAAVTATASRTLPSKSSRRDGLIAGVFVEGVDALDAALIVSSLAVKFTAVGIRPDPAGDCRFSRNGDFLVLHKPDQSARVLLVGGELAVGTTAYEIEPAKS